MYRLDTHSAENYLEWFRAQCRANDPLREAFNPNNRQVARIYFRCVRLARNIDSRAARMFLRKWKGDKERCAFVEKICKEGIEEDDKDMSMEFIEDLIRFIRHIEEFQNPSR